MINVSNSFKKAIKSNERECKGYVELICSDLGDKSNYSLSGVGDDVLEITTLSQANNGSRVVNKYATFEKDYFLLDGSFILPSEGENVNAGYISAGASDDNGYFEDMNIKINSNVITTTKGLTIYFEDDNYATNLKINDTEYTNDSNVFNIFDDIEFIDGVITITIQRIINANRRLRIAEIDLGITNVYKNQGLVSIDILNEIDLLSTSTPIGECDITISDDDGLFDLINPSGIFTKLNNNVKIIPYLGVVTETGITEYLKQGVFYYESCSINDDKTVSINAKDIMNKFSKEKFICRLEFKDNENHFPTLITEEEFKRFLNFSYYNYNFEYDFKKWLGMNMVKINDEDAIEFLRAVALLQNTVICVTSDDKIKFKTLKEDVVESLTYTELKKKPVFEKTDKINTINLVRYNTKNTSNNSTETFNHIMNEETEYISIKSNYSYNGSFSQTGANVMGTIARGLHLTTLMLIGNVGDTVTITVSGNTVYEESSSELIIYRNNQIPSSKVTFKLDNEVVTYYNPAKKQISDFVFDNSFDYKVSFDYNGNPAYECGDKVSIETDYGYKDMIITKHKLSYNGSLSGSIEGVSN